MTQICHVLLFIWGCIYLILRWIQVLFFIILIDNIQTQNKLEPLTVTETKLEFISNKVKNLSPYNSKEETQKAELNTENTRNKKTLKIYFVYRNTTTFIYLVFKPKMIMCDNKTSDQKETFQSNIPSR